MSNYDWLDTLQPISVRVTSNRTKGDSIPVEYDYYSCVTERTFSVEDGVCKVDRKRIGVAGLNDFHWVGLLYQEKKLDRSGKFIEEPEACGIWIFDNKAKTAGK